MYTNRIGVCLLRKGKLHDLYIRQILQIFDDQHDAISREQLMSKLLLNQHHILHS